MKNIKVISLIFLGLFSAGCNSVSEPSVASQVFKILTAQSAQVTRDTSVSISSVDATTTGVGGITVDGVYTPALTGADVTFTQGGSVTFSASDTALDKGSYFLLTQTDGSAAGFTTTNQLAVGGAKNNLKYGDFGYWMETTTQTGTNANYYHWAPFIIFDSAGASANIPTNDSNNYAYSGRVLGGLDLYDVNNKFVETDTVSGNITLNANFFNNTSSGSMSFNVNNTPWYNGTITSTGGAQTDGSFTGTLTLDGASYNNNGKYALTSGAGGGYVATFGGQFLGVDGQIPAEAAGLFSIISNKGAATSTVNNAGYRPEVYGSFGVKR
ncbi:MAG: hypothetical protein LBI01_05225 [Elusimicrobium sp.]|nr:hypothetical protein [Elusimicrobium sp.]